MNRIARTVLLVFLTSCVKAPVEWGDVAYRGSRLGDPDARSALLDANLPRISGTVFACPMSVRSTSDSHDLFRVWWNARADTSVVLTAQRSPDAGRTWLAPVIVDARDRGRRACDRPAPAVVFDPGSGYLHVVYFLEADDGKGVFFAHSMDKGAMFHSPVPVVYGNSPSFASVAAKGDSVVVVFEDPNAVTPRIGIVLSHTAGHIFEQRDQVTPDDVLAIKPWVSLNHREITVFWKAANANGAELGDRVGYRSGIWQ